MTKRLGITEGVPGLNTTGCYDFGNMCDGIVEAPCFVCDPSLDSRSIICYRFVRRTKSPSSLLDPAESAQILIRNRCRAAVFTLFDPSPTSW